MPMPDLMLIPGRTNKSTATGVPDNGNNQFAHGWTFDLSTIDEDQIELILVPQGSPASVTAAAFVSLANGNQDLVVNFVQGGADAVQLVASYPHTLPA